MFPWTDQDLVRVFFDNLYLSPDECYRARFRVNADARDHWHLAQATSVAALYGLPVKIIVIAYQLESIDLLILLGILEDVSVGQPRTDDAKRELQRFRNPEDGQHVRMRNVLPPNDFTIKPLIRIRFLLQSRQNTEVPHTRLTSSGFAIAPSRRALTHTCLSLWWPLQTSMDLPEA